MLGRSEGKRRRIWRTVGWKGRKEFYSWRTLKKVSVKFDKVEGVWWKSAISATSYLSFLVKLSDDEWTDAKVRWTKCDGFSANHQSSLEGIPSSSSAAFLLPISFHTHSKRRLLKRQTCDIMSFLEMERTHWFGSAIARLLSRHLRIIRLLRLSTATLTCWGNRWRRKNDRRREFCR
jgi:hypothetical protein